MYTWLLPDGFVPTNGSNDENTQWVSHESICVLNTTENTAEFFVDIYFIDREPIRKVPFQVAPERSARVIVGDSYRLANALCLNVPAGIPFSLKITSEHDIAIQYTRVDTRASNNALMSTLLPRQMG